jgi:hypothetical protein
LRTASEVATPLSEVVVSRSDDLLVELLERMAGRPDGRALVFEGDTWGQPVLVGIVSPSDVARAIQTAAMRSTDPAGDGMAGLR